MKCKGICPLFVYYQESHQNNTKMIARKAFDFSSPRKPIGIFGFLRGKTKKSVLVKLEDDVKLSLIEEMRD